MFGVAYMYTCVGLQEPSALDMKSAGPAETGDIAVSNSSVIDPTRANLFIGYTPNHARVLLWFSQRLFALGFAYPNIAPASSRSWRTRSATTTSASIAPQYAGQRLHFIQRPSWPPAQCRPSSLSRSVLISGSASGRVSLNVMPPPPE